MNKHNTHYTDSDRAKACLTELMVWYMKHKHPKVVDKMKQLIADEMKSKDQ